MKFKYNSFFKIDIVNINELKMGLTVQLYRHKSLKYNKELTFQ